jgi:hypothetical protein
MVVVTMLLTESEAERFLTIPRGRLAEWRSDGVSPPAAARLTGGRYLYEVAALQRWAQRPGQRIKPTAGLEPLRRAG